MNILWYIYKKKKYLVWTADANLTLPSAPSALPSKKKDGSCVVCDQRNWNEKGTLPDSIDVKVLKRQNNKNGNQITGCQNLRDGEEYWLRKTPMFLSLGNILYPDVGFG